MVQAERRLLNNSQPHRRRLSEDCRSRWGQAGGARHNSLLRTVNRIHSQRKEEPDFRKGKSGIRSLNSLQRETTQVGQPFVSDIGKIGSLPPRESLPRRTVQIWKM